MIKKMCCMSLRTAGIVIGWVGVACATLGAIVFSCALINVYQRADDHTPTYSDYDHTYIYNNSLKDSLIKFYIFYIGCCIYHMVISGFLVIGSVKSRHLMLLPWMITSGLAIVVSIVSIFFDVTALIGYSYGAAERGLRLLIRAVTLTISIWFYLAVHSLFNEIKFEKRNASTHGQQIPPYQHKIYPTNV